MPGFPPRALSGEAIVSLLCVPQHTQRNAPREWNDPPITLDRASKMAEEELGEFQPFSPPYHSLLASGPRSEYIQSPSLATPATRLRLRYPPRASSNASQLVKISSCKKRERESRDFRRLTDECVPKFSRPQTLRSAQESVIKILIGYLCSKSYLKRLSRYTMFPSPFVSTVLGSPAAITTAHRRHIRAALAPRTRLTLYARLASECECKNSGFNNTIRKAKEERNDLRSPHDAGVFASRTVGASQRGLSTAAILEPHTHRDREFASRAACVASERCNRLRVSDWVHAAARCADLRIRSSASAVPAVMRRRALHSVVLARDSAVRRIVLASQHDRHVGAGMQGVCDLLSGATAVSPLHRVHTPHRQSLALQPMASGLAPTTHATSAPSRMRSARAISRFAQRTRLISLAFSDGVQSRAVKQYFHPGLGAQSSPTSALSRPVPEARIASALSLFWSHFGVATWELRVGTQPMEKRRWTVQWIAWQREPYALWG
ncbi:hypothetical protein C8R44DRAFT_728562 [Mycena epipterygia]|nr:hypothetical protein C8R44DRAFT_728562 [Mycena epipterygia]